MFFSFFAFSFFSFSFFDFTFFKLSYNFFLFDEKNYVIIFLTC